MFFSMWKPELGMGLTSTNAQKTSKKASLVSVD